MIKMTIQAVKYLKSKYPRPLAYMMTFKNGLLTNRFTENDLYYIYTQRDLKDNINYSTYRVNGIVYITY